MKINDSSHYHLARWIASRAKFAVYMFTCVVTPFVHAQISGPPPTDTPYLGISAAGNKLGSNNASTRTLLGAGGTNISAACGTSALLWDNGSFNNVSGLASEENTLVSNARTADDFVFLVPSTVNQVTADMQVTPGGTFTGMLDIFVTETNGNGPSNSVPPLSSVTSTTYTVVGSAFGFDVRRYIFTLADVAFAPGRYWVNPYLTGVGADRAFFATSNGATPSAEQAGYFRSTFFGYPTWTLATAPSVSTGPNFAFTVSGCPSNIPPQFSATPFFGSTLSFTGGSSIGSTGTVSVAIGIQTAGTGAGPAATTTLTCTAPTAPFAGFTESISAVGAAGSTSGGPLTGSCTLGAAAVTQTLTCNENRGGTNVAQTWTLSCPQATEPPALAYSPTAGNTVNFTGVTNSGSSGSGIISVTPSGGLNTGAGATSTVNNCALSGADAANFSGASAVNLSFVGNTTTAQNISLACTSGTVARNSTLTCDETRGTAAPVQRTWSLVCPLGTSAPQFAYVPAPSTTVNATGGSSIGSTGNLSIAVNIGIAGSGTGAPATTTTTCTAPTAPFAGFTESISAVGAAGSTSGGPLTGSCTLGAAAVTQTLTCNENRGGTNVAQTWTLSCPAGTLLPITSSVTSGGTVALPPVIAGAPPPTATLSFTNPNVVSATVTCTAPNAPFAVSPLVLNLGANGGSQSVTVSAYTGLPGNYSATLNCAVGGSPQTFSFTLNASVSNPPPVPSLSLIGYCALLIGMLFAGMFATAIIRRD